MNDESAKPKVALGVFYIFMLISSWFLLALLSYETHPGPQRQGWWTQPILMPGISITLMFLTSAYLVVQHFYKMSQNEDLRHDIDAVLAEIMQWIKPAEYFLYYVGYIWLLGMVGYFLSSLIFIVGLCFRVGLRSTKWMVISLLTAIALIALFRWGLQVWIPPAKLYDLFPKDTRAFLIRKF